MSGCIKSYRRNSDFLWEALRVNYTQESFANCCLVGSDGSALCHQLILGSASDWLRSLLLERSPEQEDTVTIVMPDFKISSITETLSFLYGFNSFQPHLLGLLEHLQVDLCHPSGLGQDQVPSSPIRRPQDDQFSDYTQELPSLATRGSSQGSVSDRLRTTKRPARLLEAKSDGDKSKATSSGRKRQYFPVSGGWQCAKCKVTKAKRALFSATNHCEGLSQAKEQMKDLKIEVVVGEGAIEGGGRTKAKTVPVFECNHCDKSYNNKSSFKYHSQKHLNPVLKCSQCPRSFKSTKGLKYHLNIHNGIADYLCDDCGRGFVTRQKLLFHRRSKHTLEKPYICDKCGDAFVRSDKLADHMRRLHTKEKPYACPDCPWKGVDSSGLIHHKKKHLGDKKATLGL